MQLLKRGLVGGSVSDARNEEHVCSVTKQIIALCFPPANPIAASPSLASIHSLGSWWCFANVHSCSTERPLLLVDYWWIWSIQATREQNGNRSPHKVQIKLLCCFFFCFFSSSLPIGCFHNKTKCVLGVSQQQLGESESLKRSINVTLLNRVSATLQASRLQLLSRTPL